MLLNISTLGFKGQESTQFSCTLYAFCVLFFKHNDGEVAQLVRASDS